MKFKSVTFCNRKKRINTIYSNNKEYEVHYSELGIKRNIKNILIDTETKGLSLIIELDDGELNYMPYDQILYLRKDPEYMLKLHIQHIVADIKKALKEQKISKAFLRDALKTSDSQLNRLLDSKKINKNLFQLYKLSNLLKLEPEFCLKKVA